MDLVDTTKILMMDGFTTLAKVIANCNVVSNKSTYVSKKLRGEIIFNVADGEYYGNYAADGATEDWKLIGGGGSGTDSTTFTLNQDNVGVGVNCALAVERGTSGEDATLFWDETNQRWASTLTSVYAPFMCSRLYIGNSNTYLYVNATGNLVLHVPNGKGIVYEEGAP